MGLPGQQWGGTGNHWSHKHEPLMTFWSPEEISFPHRSASGLHGILWHRGVFKGLHSASCCCRDLRDVAHLSGSGCFILTYFDSRNMKNNETHQPQLPFQLLDSWIFHAPLADHFRWQCWCPWASFCWPWEVLLVHELKAFWTTGSTLAQWPWPNGARVGWFPKGSCNRCDHYTYFYKSCKQRRMEPSSVTPCYATSAMGPLSQSLLLL